MNQAAAKIRACLAAAIVLLATAGSAARGGDADDVFQPPKPRRIDRPAAKHEEPRRLFEGDVQQTAGEKFEPPLLVAPAPLPALPDQPPVPPADPNAGWIEPIQPLPQEVAAQAQQALALEFSRPYSSEPNLGTERVAFAPFQMDVARPQDVFRIRIDSAWNRNFPDRAEYFWGKIGGNGPPKPERRVDYQDYSIYHETARGNASGFIQVKLRALNPDVNDNATGISNLQFGAKAVLLEGDDFFFWPTSRRNDNFRISSIFRTYISPSSTLAKRGLTTGHVSLEPGLLANYEMSPRTHLHGQLKYWIPLGGDQQFSGNVLRYGAGVSRVLYSASPEACGWRNFAVIPTLELVGWTFTSGNQTLPNGSIVGVNSTTVLNLSPGVRIPIGKRLELGLNYSHNLTGPRLYQNLARFEIRWFR